MVEDFGPVGRQEEIIVIQLPNSTNFYLGSGSQSPGAITGCFEVSHYPKLNSLITQSNYLGLNIKT
jgi:hypothetical protein